MGGAMETTSGNQIKLLSLKTYPLGRLLIPLLLLLISLQVPGLESAGAANKWALWQTGPKLRGANIYQRRSYPDPAIDGDLALVGPVIPPYSQADFDKLAAMGANYVNISHPGLFTEQPPYTVDPAIQANLDQLLAKIAQADMFAVIAFRTGPGRNEFIFLDEEDPNWLAESRDINFVWTSAAAQDAWVNMWRYTAQRYRNNPVVAGYDLMVEPNSNVLLNIWDPAEFYPDYANSLYNWNQLYPRITAAIRQVDPNTPILIGGMSYSAVTWLPYLKPTGDPYTVYTVHNYEPFVYTHQYPPGLVYPGSFDGNGDSVIDSINKSWLNSLLSPIDTFKNTYHVPVAVNEYGLMRWEVGASQYMADMMALLEQRGLNHAWWLWAPSDERFTEYTHYFNPRLGPSPANRDEVATSLLLEVIRQNWQLNILRPSKQFLVFLPAIVKK